MALWSAVKLRRSFRQISRFIKLDGHSNEDVVDAARSGSEEHTFAHDTKPQYYPRFTLKTCIFPSRLLSGLAPLCIAVWCVFAALVILLLSDGSSVETWPIQPSVYLVTALTNTAIALARLEAVPAAWWHGASRGGTVKSLERDFQVTRSAIQALRYLRRPSLLNVACIFAMLVAVDNPLIQRASTIQNASRNVTVDVNIAAQLPRGFSGVKSLGKIYSGSSSIPRGTQTSGDVVSNFFQNEPIRLAVPGCGDLCTTTILGPGMELWSSDTTSRHITPAMLYSMNATWGPNAPGTEYGNKVLDMFLISGTPVSGSIQQQEYWTGIGRLQFSPRNDSSFVYAQYTLRPATRRYDITITRNEVSIDHSEFVTWAHNTDSPLLDEHSGNDYSQEFYHLSTIDDFALVVDSVFKTFIEVILGPSYGHIPWTFQEAYNAQFYKYLVYSSPTDFRFRDPFPDILSTFNELMLRGGIMSSSWKNITDLIDPETQVHQKVRVETFRTVFHSDFRWWAGAACIELLTILLVFSMFWGSWTLENDLNLSPFNMALAFDSPLLDGISPADGAKGVVRAMGDTIIAFGQAKRFGITHAPDSKDTAGFSSERRLSV